MNKKFDIRRAVFARRAIAKKALNSVLVAGVSVQITEKNARFAEAVRQADAERAYEQAAYARLGGSGTGQRVAA